MMKSKFRALAAAFAVIMCMMSFSITAFAVEDSFNDPTIAETSPVTEPMTTEPAATEPVTTEPGPTETEKLEQKPEGEENGQLTPDGNMTLIDDMQTDSQKQFITLQSKNGNFFYLIIDRSGDTENVHFLNQVDEADLMALMEEAESTLPAGCTCKEKCVAGKVNTSCPVCKNDVSKCVGKEPATDQDATEVPSETPDSTDTAPNKATAVLALVLIIGAGAGGAVYWFKFRKP